MSFSHYTLDSSLASFLSSIRLARLVLLRYVVFGLQTYVTDVRNTLGAHAGAQVFLFSEQLDVFILTEFNDSLGFADMRMIR